MHGLKNTDVAVVKRFIGKTITAIELQTRHPYPSPGREEHGFRALVLTFTDNSKLTLWDDGQLHAERRYMQTDDNLTRFVGAQLLDVEMQDGPSRLDGDVHSVRLLTIITSNGEFVIANHNEHGGSCDWFRITALSSAT